MNYGSDPEGSQPRSISIMGVSLCASSDLRIAPRQKYTDSVVAKTPGKALLLKPEDEKRAVVSSRVGGFPVSKSLLSFFPRPAPTTGDAT